MAFSEIVGQPKAVKLLSRALAGNRLAHAYLFSGPDGVGKTTTALALTAYLFCKAPKDERPCGLCSGCLKFSSGNHPDFLAIKPDGAAIKIDQVRALIKELSFSPFEGAMRVVLIEDVQTMTRNAANSLLKILEEPPPDNLLLLVASDSEPILSTIISRCQLIPFVPLSLDEAAAVIHSIDPELPPEEARAMSALTGGCPGQAMAMHDEEILQLRSACIQALLATDRSEAVSVEAALDLAGRVTDSKEGLDLLVDLLAVFFKDVMVAVLCDAESQQDADLERARERWNLQQLSDMVQAVDNAGPALARNCNRALVCEVMMLELFSAAGRN